MGVTVTRQGGIALVLVDNPPVNAVGLEVREGLLDACAATEADPAIKAVVLACRGRTFIAGADVREFGTPPVPPHLPDVLARIEGATKPWIAAVHGTALGGGLETALACSYRIAEVSAKLGFPEVTLGVIPGAGGTVRLPRVVGAKVALEMIVTGKPVSAQRALDTGLVDQLVERSLLEAAADFATDILRKAPPLPVSQRPVELPDDPQAVDRLEAQLLARAGGHAAPGKAAKAVRNAMRLPVQDAFERERAMFLDLRASDEAAALRHIFFAERAAGRSDRVRGVTARPIETIGIVGGGTMGAGIAAACLLAGLRVHLVERDAEAAEAGHRRVAEILAGSLKRGKISKDVHGRILKAFVVSDQMSDLNTADLVIEAVFEDMAAKSEVFARLDAVVRPDCVLATNTSYLDVDVLARTSAHPERVLGLHFFSPAHIMKLLEVVVPDDVDETSLATGLALAKRLGKTAVLAGVCDGFIANRIMARYRREADYMIEDGALPSEIDAAMRAFGFPMGVFEMQDLAGLDISWAMRKRQAATRDPSERYVDIGDRLCEKGHFGRKAGRGYYVYEGGAAPRPSKVAEELIVSESARKGIVRRAFDAEEINERILSVMQAEGQKVLDEGIAHGADDIDVVLVNAFRFPRWKGGPMFMGRSG